MNQLSKNILSIKTNKLTYFIASCLNVIIATTVSLKRKQIKVEDFIGLKRKKTKTRNLS